MLGKRWHRRRRSARWKRRRFEVVNLFADSYRFPLPLSFSFAQQTNSSRYSIRELYCVTVQKEREATVPSVKLLELLARLQPFSLDDGRVCGRTRTDANLEGMRHAVEPWGRDKFDSIQRGTHNECERMTAHRR
jgi:hypothetical protein